MPLGDYSSANYEPKTCSLKNQKLQKEINENIKMK